MTSCADPSAVDVLQRCRADELLEQAPDAVLVSDGEGRIVFANAQAELMFGYARAELLGAPVEQLMPERFARAHVQRRRAYASMPATRPMGVGVPLVGQRKDGSEFPVEISLSAVGSAGDLLVTSFIRDVTERRRTERDLRENRQIHSLILDSLDAQIAILDAAGTVTAVNDAWKRLVLESTCVSAVDGGLDKDGLLLCRLILPASAEAMAHVLAGIESVLEGSQPRFVAEYSDDASASGRWFLVKVTALSDKQRGAVVYHTEITERKQLEQGAIDQARRDGLTGVFNHGATTALLRDYLAGGDGQPNLAVALFNVDGMKAINDTYGHGVGDEVLVTLSRTISRAGAVVGRFGGDEFVAILPGADHAAATRYRDAVLREVADKQVIDPASGGRIPVSISIGSALYPGEAAIAEDLLRLAAAAMHSSRRANRVRGSALARSFADDAAATTMKEIVSLMTSPGESPEKLRLVAHRICVVAGYDAVGIQLFGDVPGLQAKGAFTTLPADIARTLNDDFYRFGSRAVRKMLGNSHRPVSLDIPATDERLTKRQRARARSAGLRSAFVVPIVEGDRLIGVLSAASRRPQAFGVRDALLLTTVAAQVAAIARMSALVTDLRAAAENAKHAHAETVMMLAATAEAHDHTTGLHLRNIQTLTVALARELGYADEAASELGLAAILHDIGKIRVAKEILLSPKKLSEAEWAVVKRHTIWGAEFLVGRRAFKLAATVARCHHERWDGSGYPIGLRARAIPEEAAIVAVADAFDAMTHDRPYRPALTTRDAIARITAGSGTQFSPRIVRALLALYRRGELHVEEREQQLEAA